MENQNSRSINKTTTPWLEEESTVPEIGGVPIHHWAEMSDEWRVENGLPPLSRYRQSLVEDLERKRQYDAERLRRPHWSLNK